MHRKPVRTVMYQPANPKTPGHFKCRITMRNGSRVWHHFEASPDTPESRERFKALAAELAERVRTPG